MTQFVVKPVDGQIVRSPDHGGAPLPPEGLPVTWSPYWQARLDDGDVIKVEPEESKDSAPASLATPQAAKSRPAKSED